MNLKNKSIVVMSSLLVSGMAMADTYQSEISANAIRLDQNGFNSDSNQYGLMAKYYFNAVDTSNVPLVEAAFLGKNSGVYGGVHHGEYTGIYYHYGDDKNFNSYRSTFNIYHVGAEFYIPENFLYISGGASREKSTTHLDSNINLAGETRDSWYTSVGVTPIEGVLVSTRYQYDSGGSNDHGYHLNVHGKYVTEIGNGQFVNLEAALVDLDGGSSNSIGGDFYFDKSFSLGAEINHRRQYSWVDNTYTLRTTKFFTERFSGSLSYSDGSDNNDIQASVSLRF